MLNNKIASGNKNLVVADIVLVLELDDGHLVPLIEVPVLNLLADILGEGGHLHECHRCLLLLNSYLNTH